MDGITGTTGGATMVFTTLGDGIILSITEIPITITTEEMLWDITITIDIETTILIPYQKTTPNEATVTNTDQIATTPKATIIAVTLKDKQHTDAIATHPTLTIDLIATIEQPREVRAQVADLEQVALDHPLLALVEITALEDQVQIVIEDKK